ncbi:MAG: hypothetical protein AB2705_21205, partial [Candidatus Thiodiazotropha sp.]
PMLPRRLKETKALLAHLLTYETEFIIFLAAMLENSDCLRAETARTGRDSSYGTLKVTSFIYKCHLKKSSE